MSLRSTALAFSMLLLTGCVPSSEEVGSLGSASHACSSPLDPCDDGNTCTTDQCDLMRGTCQHLPIPNCCETVDDCPARVCQTVACEPDESAITVCVYRSVVPCDAGVPMDAGPPDGSVADGGSVAADAGPEGMDGGPTGVDGAVAGDGGPRDQGIDEPTPQVRGGACSTGGSASRRGATLVLLAFLLLAIRRRSVLALTLLGSLCAAPAAAQRIEPDVPTAPDDLSMVERAAPELERLAPALRVDATYADDPLVAVVGDEERPLVGERFRLSLAASLAFLERAHVALRLGLVAQDGLGAAGVAEGQPGLASFAFAAPALDGRVVILDREAPLELALAATLRLPVGTEDAFVRDRGASVWPRVLLARQLDERGSFVALSLGVDVRPRETLGDLTIDSLWTFGLGGAVAVGERSALTLELRGATVFAGAFDGAHSPLRAIAGLRWRSDALSVHVWGGLGLSPGFGTPDALFGASFGWRSVPRAPGA